MLRSFKAETIFCALLLIACAPEDMSDDATDSGEAVAADPQAPVVDPALDAGPAPDAAPTQDAESPPPQDAEPLPPPQDAEPLPPPPPMTWSGDYDVAWQKIASNCVVPSATPIYTVAAISATAIGVPGSIVFKRPGYANWGANAVARPGDLLDIGQLPGGPSCAHYPWTIDATSQHTWEGVLVRQCSQASGIPCEERFYATAVRK